MRFLLFGLIFLFSNLIFSQKIPDWQLRLSPSLEYKFAKKWEANATYRLSLDHDMSQFRSSYFFGSIGYKILPKLTAEMAYVYTTSNIQDFHQMRIELGFKQKLSKRFQLKNNLRYQYQFNPIGISGLSQDVLEGSLIRNKLTFDYNVPKLRSNISIGPEFIIDPIDRFYPLTRMRYHASIDYEFKYGNNVELGFFYEDRINYKKQDRFVLSVKYKLKIQDLVKRIQKDKAKRAKEALKKANINT